MHHLDTLGNAKANTRMKEPGPSNNPRGNPKVGSRLWLAGTKTGPSDGSIHLVTQSNIAMATILWRDAG